MAGPSAVTGFAAFGHGHASSSGPSPAPPDGASFQPGHHAHPQQQPSHNYQPQHQHHQQQQQQAAQHHYAQSQHFGHQPTPELYPASTSSGLYSASQHDLAHGTSHSFPPGQPLSAVPAARMMPADNLDDPMSPYRFGHPSPLLASGQAQLAAVHPQAHSQHSHHSQHQQQRGHQQQQHHLVASSLMPHQQGMYASTAASSSAADQQAAMMGTPPLVATHAHHVASHSARYSVDAFSPAPMHQLPHASASAGTSSMPLLPQQHTHAHESPILTQHQHMYASSSHLNNGAGPDVAYVTGLPPAHAASSTTQHHQYYNGPAQTLPPHLHGASSSHLQHSQPAEPTYPFRPVPPPSVLGFGDSSVSGHHQPPSLPGPHNAGRHSLPNGAPSQTAMHGMATLSSRRDRAVSNGGGPKVSGANGSSRRGGGAAANGEGSSKAGRSSTGASNGNTVGAGSGARSGKGKGESSSAAATSAGASKGDGVTTVTIFQCRGFEGCNMTFSRSEHLARHVRKHTGERPFPCHCGKAFSRLDNLRQHAQTVHSDTPEKNETMMQELVVLHANLAASAAQMQHAHMQVTNKVVTSEEKAAREREGREGGGGSYAFEAGTGSNTRPGSQAGLDAPGFGTSPTAASEKGGGKKESKSMQARRAAARMSATPSRSALGPNAVTEPLYPTGSSGGSNLVGTTNGSHRDLPPPPLSMSTSMAPYNHPQASALPPGLQQPGELSGMATSQHLGFGGLMPQPASSAPVDIYGQSQPHLAPPASNHLVNAGSGAEASATFPGSVASYPNAPYQAQSHHPQGVAPPVATDLTHGPATGAQPEALEGTSTNFEYYDAHPGAPSSSTLFNGTAAAAVTPQSGLRLTPAGGGVPAAPLSSTAAVTTGQGSTPTASGAALVNAGNTGGSSSTTMGAGTADSLGGRRESAYSSLSSYHTFGGGPGGGGAGSGAGNGPWSSASTMRNNSFGDPLSASASGIFNIASGGVVSSAASGAGGLGSGPLGPIQGDDTNQAAAADTAAHTGNIFSDYDANNFWLDSYGLGMPFVRERAKSQSHGTAYHNNLLAALQQRSQNETTGAGAVSGVGLGNGANGLGSAGGLFEGITGRRLSRAVTPPPPSSSRGRPVSASGRPSSSRSRPVSSRQSFGLGSVVPFGQRPSSSAGLMGLLDFPLFSSQAGATGNSGTNGGAGNVNSTASGSAPQNASDIPSIEEHLAATSESVSGSWRQGRPFTPSVARQGLPSSDSRNGSIFGSLGTRLRSGHKDFAASSIGPLGERRLSRSNISLEPLGSAGVGAKRPTTGSTSFEPSKLGGLMGLLPSGSSSGRTGSRAGGTAGSGIGQGPSIFSTSFSLGRGRPSSSSGAMPSLASIMDSVSGQAGTTETPGTSGGPGTSTTRLPGLASRLNTAGSDLRTSPPATSPFMFQPPPVTATPIQPNSQGTKDVPTILPPLSSAAGRPPSSSARRPLGSMGSLFSAPPTADPGSATGALLPALRFPGKRAADNERDGVDVVSKEDSERHAPRLRTGTARSSPSEVAAEASRPGRDQDGVDSSSGSADDARLLLGLSSRGSVGDGAHVPARPFGATDASPSSWRNNKPTTAGDADQHQSRPVSSSAGAVSDGADEARRGSISSDRRLSIASLLGPSGPDVGSRPTTASGMGLASGGAGSAGSFSSTAVSSTMRPSLESISKESAPLPSPDKSNGAAAERSDTTTTAADTVEDAKTLPSSDSGPKMSSSLRVASATKTAADLDLSPKSLPPAALVDRSAQAVSTSTS